MAATLFGALYAAGFVIVNAYLGAYGVRELEAIRTRYVGAGIVFIVFAVLGPALLSGFETLLIWRANAGPFGDQAMPAAFGQPFAVAVFISNETLLLIASGARALGRLPAGRFAMPVRGLFSWFAVFGLAGIVVGYASYIYPAIPAWLGGGVPSRVKLVVSQTVLDACPACGRDDVQLIDEDSHRWVVLVRDADGREHAVEIFLLANSDRAIVHTR